MSTVILHIFMKPLVRSFILFIVTSHLFAGYLLADFLISDASIISQMRMLQPLPKVHYSWKLEAGFLFDKGQEDLLYQYARITNALSFAGEWATEEIVEKCVYNCARVNKLKPAILASIGINYSPYHRRFDANLPPTDRGLTYEAEIDLFSSRLNTIKRWIDKANKKYMSDVSVGAVLLDMERFHYRPDNDEWNEGMREALDIVHKIAAEIFPSARIEWYGRGIKKVWEGNGWARTPYWTGKETKAPLSCSLYTLPELIRTREVYRRTCKLADELGIDEVTPWVALASGYRRDIEKGQKWAENWDYDLFYSWQIGAELNIPWFAARPERYAQYDKAKIVVFYPAPFNRTTPLWGKHFIAYVRGATGVKAIEDLDGF